MAPPLKNIVIVIKIVIPFLKGKLLIVSGYAVKAVNTITSIVCKPAYITVFK